MASMSEDELPITPDDRPSQDAGDSGHSKKLCIGYLLLLLLNVTDSSPVIFAQLAVGKTSIFELNVIRFTFQAAFCLVICLVRVQSLKVTHVWYLTSATALLDYCFAAFVYMGASYMPVGNVFGEFVASYVLFTLCIDFCRKRVKPLFLLSGIPAILGIILLTQPWHSHYSPSADCVPCDVMDGHTPTHCWNNTIQNHSDIHQHMVAQVDVTVPRSNHLIGHLLLIVAALSSSISSNISSKLVNLNDPFAVTFWISVQEGILSLLITLLVKSVDHTTWALPETTWCLTFTFLFTFIAGINDITWIICFCFLPVSHVSVGSSPNVLTLYVCQRTFLHQFYPGNANTLELFGAFLVFTGVVMSPVLAACRSKQREGYVKI